jgi:hypothetical protein
MLAFSAQRPTRTNHFATMIARKFLGCSAESGNKLMSFQHLFVN